MILIQTLSDFDCADSSCHLDQKVYHVCISSSLAQNEADSLQFQSRLESFLWKHKQTLKLIRVDISLYLILSSQIQKCGFLFQPYLLSFQTKTKNRIGRFEFDLHPDSFSMNQR